MGIFDFESKKEKYIFYSLVGVLFVVGALVAKPVMGTYLQNKKIENMIIDGMDPAWHLK